MGRSKLTVGGKIILPRIVNCYKKTARITICGFLRPRGDTVRANAFGNEAVESQIPVGRASAPSFKLFQDGPFISGRGRLFLDNPPYCVILNQQCCFASCKTKVQWFLQKTLFPYAPS